jgi:hypothetical protein
LDVTLTVVLVDIAPGFHVVGDNVNVAPVCFTVTALEIPPTVTVTVPVLLVAPVLAAALIVNEPLPIRRIGVILLIVSHATLLLGALHNVRVLVVTLILELPASAP